MVSTSNLFSLSVDIGSSPEAVSPFNFTSIDLSHLGRGLNVSISVQFTGFVRGGGVVRQTVTTDGAFGLQTFTFSGFTNLLSLDIFGTTGLSPQIDNVNVSRVTAQTAPVPEPATILLLGTGLAGLGGVIRRRRRGK